MDDFFDRDTTYSKVDTKIIITLSGECPYRVVCLYESVNGDVLSSRGVTLFIAIKEKKQSIFAFLIMGILIIKRLMVYPYELLLILIRLIIVSFDSIVKNKKILIIITVISEGSFALYLIHPIVLQMAIKMWSKASANSVVLYAAYLYVVCIVTSYMVYYGIIAKIERAIIGKFL